MSSDTRPRRTDQTTDERLADEVLPFHLAPFVGRERELRRLQVVKLSVLRSGTAAWFSLPRAIVHEQKTYGGR